MSTQDAGDEHSPHRKCQRDHWARRKPSETDSAAKSPPRPFSPASRWHASDFANPGANHNEDAPCEHGSQYRSGKDCGDIHQPGGSTER